VSQHFLQTTLRRRVQYSVAALSVMVALALGQVTALASTDFTAFAPPITGANDWIINLPAPFGVGPIGLIDDGTNFFVANFGNGNLYRLPAAGGDASTATSAPDGLFGLALSNGTYFGSDLGLDLRTFDPTTLATTTTNVVLPCGGLGIASDPLSSDLYVNTSCGMYRVQNATSVTPTVTFFSTGNTDVLDGLTISADGQQFWAADLFARSVVEFNRSGVFVQSIPDSAGPDGVGIAQPNTTSGGINVSNNVFVNNNDGTVWRVDTNNGNTVTVVASGGTRGDMAAVGPDGCLYVTQADRVEQLTPCFFQTAHFAPALSQGYWKNHQAQTSSLLPIKLGSYAVSTSSQARAVFDASNCGKSTQQNAVGCLAAQLLAAELNQANHAQPASCVVNAISSANAFLGGLPYVGPSGSYALTQTQRQAAISLATTLDNFNNGSLTC
jgi:hypothetical protein